MMEKIKKTSEFLKEKGFINPEVAIILGTGMSELAKIIEVKAKLSYKDIPDFPISTVESHAGELIYGELAGKRVIAMAGRFHFYEGYDFQTITFPVRVMLYLGAKLLIVSNAAGGVNPLFKAGEIMLITDHINFLPGNPLRGKNLDQLGPRFPDGFEVYPPKYQEIAEEAALEVKIPLRKGVYLAIQGPNLETGAEYRMIRVLGADAVGMSTVPEALVAKHMNIPVVGFSVITDMGLPDHMEPVSFEYVVNNAKKAEENLKKLITRFLEKVTL
ncbi:MAG: Purine nucleoside phosphorylase [candidate division TA06 bacterium 32_111]|uniref:Purine nucleoside phosphorylase n=2 Tax=Bacteria candidate phyla TaxID=1783234 RepID=A0A101I316_UNCT6|nr:MAG: Purine nucleoside phosphorylase [candidate division TA06 bacterium 32_111]KUK87449.1 MAG: Purine nucleoside phosphorylase [candidate division TA06 bacterium 34_109]